MDGVPLFEQVAVLREVDLHYNWAPCCTSSMTVANLDKLDTVGWAVVGLPKFGLARDACFRAIGCDSILEDGSFVVVGQGVDDRPPDVPYDESYFLENMERVVTPDATTRIGFGRMTIRHFAGVVQVLSPTRLKTKIVANINPNVALVPKSLLDFVMRKMCGVVFSKLQHAAKKAAEDPIRNVHAQRMRQESEFYREWLYPKFQAYCEIMGWTMPPVAAFEVTEEDLAVSRLFWNGITATSRLAHRPSAPSRCLTSMQESAVETAPLRTSVHSAPPELQIQTVDTDSSDAHADYSDTNSASDVSGTSMKTRFRDNNPIALYLREIEERTQRQKLLKIEEGRKQMAEQLRPRSMSEEDFARLQQLKQAKARRLRKVVHSSIQQQSEDEGISEDSADEVETYSFADRFHTHGRSTRFIMTFILGTVLLVTLYSDRLLDFDSHLRTHADTIWMNIVLDVATFLYLAETAAVFFVLSYVSLVYAFDSLDIGTRSGRRSKEYYGETISYVVGGISGGIVALSVGKALAGVWFRVSLWYILQAVRFARQELQNGLADQQHLGWFLDHVPKAFQDVTATVLPHVSPIVRSTVGTGKAAVLFVQHWFVVICIRSNFLGRMFAALTLRAFGVFSYLAIVWEQYVAGVVDMYNDEDVTLASWRGTAIDTARPLLAYAAVFLVTLLALFNATAKKQQPQAEKKEEPKQKKQDTVSVSAVSFADIDTFPTEPMMPPPPTPIVTTPTRAFRKQDVSSISLQEESIGEGDDTISKCRSTESSRKRRFRLRLRKKKKKMNQVTDDGCSVQSSLTGMSSFKI